MIFKLTLILTFVWLLNPPSNCYVIPTNNSSENAGFAGLHSLLGDDGLVLGDIWKDIMNTSRLQTQHERFSVLHDGLKRINELRQKWDEEERRAERIRKEQERQERERQERERQEKERQQQERQEHEIYMRNKQRRTERNYKKLSMENEKSWYHNLFQWTLPGQMYSLYSYLRSLK